MGNTQHFMYLSTIPLSLISFFFLVKTNLSTHGGFEPVTYHKECLNSAPIHHQSKALWAPFAHFTSY